MFQRIQLGASVVPRRIFVPLNRHGCPNIESKCLSRRFVIRPYIELCNAFYVNLYTLNSKNLFNIAPDHSVCSSVQLKYTKYKCTGMPKKNSRYDTGGIGITH